MNKWPHPHRWHNCQWSRLAHKRLQSFNISLFVPKTAGLDDLVENPRFNPNQYRYKTVIFVTRRGVRRRSVCCSQYYENERLKICTKLSFET